MQSLINIFLVIFAMLLGIVCIVGITKGIDLSTKSGWFFVCCAFFLGIILGILIMPADSVIGSGFGVAFFVWLTGDVLRRQKELFSPWKDDVLFSKSKIVKKNLKTEYSKRTKKSKKRKDLV